MACPNCGQPIPRGIPICPHCRTGLTGSRHVRPRPPRKTPGGGVPGGERTVDHEPRTTAVPSIDVTAPPAPVGVACPDPTCGFVNVATRTSCDRCNAPLAAEPRPMTDGPGIRFPWGIVTITQALIPGVLHLPIGRDRSWSPIAHELDAYSNISRRHAELQVEHGVVQVQDVGSINGTFLNSDSEPLPAGRMTPLRHGDRLRFASTLQATIELPGGFR